MPPSGQPAAGPGNAFSWRFVTPLFMGSALNPVNSSILGTALIPIAAAVQVPVGRTAVLVSVLYLASAIAQPTGGKMSEEFGPRRVLVTDAMTDGNADAHHNSITRIFPRLGETAPTGEVLEKLGAPSWTI